MNAGSIIHLKPNLTKLKPVCKGQYFGSILQLQRSPEVGSFSVAARGKFLEGLWVKKSSECSTDSQVKANKLQKHSVCSLVEDEGLCLCMMLLGSADAHFCTNWAMQCISVSLKLIQGQSAVWDVSDQPNTGIKHTKFHLPLAPHPVCRV